MNTQTTTERLTPTELCRYIDQNVLQGDHPEPCQLIAVGLTNILVKRTIQLGGSKEEQRDYFHPITTRIRPILRSIGRMSIGEVKEWFRIACNNGWKAETVEISPTMVSAELCGTVLTMALQDNMVLTSCITDFQGQDLPGQFAASLGIDYLDSIGIDTRGLIESGRAVELTTVPSSPKNVM